MVNVILPKWKRLWKPTDCSAGRQQVSGGHMAICQRKPTTGGTGASEFTEISGGTQEIRKFPAGTGYLRHKCQTQGRKDEFPEVGVSHSSDEAGNDRGVKGWQTDRA